MRNVVIAVLIVIVCICGAYGDSSNKTELKLSGEAFFPEDDDNWDKGIGGGAKVIFWQNNGFGLGLSIGAQKWDVNDKIYTERYYLGDGIGYGVAAGLDGDAMMFPLGLSGLYDLQIGKSATLTLEAGVRYIIVNSDVKLGYAEALADSYGNYIVQGDEYDVDIENGFVGFIGADFNFTIAQGIKLFAGAGYQIDISKGEVEFDGYGTDEENELKAAFVRAGLAWDF